MAAGDGYFAEETAAGAGFEDGGEKGKKRKDGMLLLLSFAIALVIVFAWIAWVYSPYWGGKEPTPVPPAGAKSYAFITVIDDAGRPLAGAQVSLILEKQSLSQKTDSNGNATFTIESKPGKPVAIIAEKDGYVRDMLTLTPKKASFSATLRLQAENIGLEPAETVSILAIVTYAGSPRQASVTLYDRESGMEIAQASSDAKGGMARFPKVPKGALTSAIAFSDDGGIGMNDGIPPASEGLVFWIELGQNEVARNLTAFVYEKAYGKTTASKGARVWAVENATWRKVFQNYTDSGGKAVMPIPNRTLVVFANKMGFLPAKKTITAETTLLTLTIEKAGLNNAYAVFANATAEKAPVQGALAEIVSPDGMPLGYLQNLTGPDGLASFTVAKTEGAIAASAYWAGLSNISAARPPSQWAFYPVSFSPPKTKVAFTVRSAQSLPIRDASIQLIMASNGTVEASCATNATGHCTVNATAGREFYATASAAGYMDYATERFRAGLLENKTMEIVLEAMPADAAKFYNISFVGLYDGFGNHALFAKENGRYNARYRIVSFNPADPVLYERLGSGCTLPSDTATVGAPEYPGCTSVVGKTALRQACAGWQNGTHPNNALASFSPAPNGTAIIDVPLATGALPAGAPSQDFPTAYFFGEPADRVYAEDGTALGTGQVTVAKADSQCSGGLCISAQALDSNGAPSGVFVQYSQGKLFVNGTTDEPVTIYLESGVLAFEGTNHLEMVQVTSAGGFSSQVPFTAENIGLESPLKIYARRADGSGKGDNLTLYVSVIGAMALNLSVSPPNATKGGVFLATATLKDDSGNPVASAIVDFYNCASNPLQAGARAAEGPVGTYTAILLPLSAGKIGARATDELGQADFCGITVTEPDIVKVAPDSVEMPGRDNATATIYVESLTDLALDVSVGPSCNGSFAIEAAPLSLHLSPRASAQIVISPAADYHERAECAVSVSARVQASPLASEKTIQVTLLGQDAPTPVPAAAIAVITDPFGANVYLNGVFKGISSPPNLTITGLQAGSYLVNATMAGYDPNWTYATAMREETTTVNLALGETAGPCSPSQDACSDPHILRINMSVGGQCMAQDRTCNGQANLFCIEESCGDEKYFCSPLEGDWKWRRAGECPYDGDIIHGFSQLPDEILVNVTWCNRSGTLFLPTLFDFTSSYSLRPHQDNDPQSAQVPTWIDDPDGDPSHGLLLVFKFDYTDPAQVIGNMSLTFAMANGTTSKAVKIMFKVSTIPLSIGDEGLDVSHWQSAMDWETAKGKGIKFTFMKATEGTYFHDDQFARNWAETKRLGIARGAYHYFRFDYDPEAQAAYFADAISAQGNDGELMPIANVEIGNSGYDSGEPKSSNANKIKRFLEKCDQLTGASCGIYTSAAMWNAVAGTTDWAHERPLWVADWLAQSPTLPDDWANKGALAIFWQYSGDSPGTPQDGREYGAQSTYVDHNRYINEGTFSACPQ